MADEEIIEEEAPPRKRKRRWAKRVGWAVAILLAPIVLAAAFLSSPIGKRFVADQIAQVAPASGLRFEVGRIEGDIYAQATLHDVTLFDPQGEFLTIPEVELNWRPLAWLWSGLDIREVTARRGTLLRLPELLPGDPDAPLLPDFDIRVDHFEIDNLTLAPGLAGEEAQRVDLVAEVDIRSGRARVSADGTLGAEDRLSLLLDAEPDGDRFDLALDYVAPQNGVIAGLAGLEQGYTAQIEGEGTWSEWLGHALIMRQSEDRGAERFAGFKLSNHAGRYALLGQVTPGLEGEGIVERALGEAVSLSLIGTLEESVFDGELAAVTRALDLRGEGAVDLAGNTFDDFAANARLRDPALLGDSFLLEDARLTAALDGAFRDLSIAHTLDIGALVSGDVRVEALAQQGTASFDGTIWSLPLDASADRIVTGNAIVDPSLVSANLTGEIAWSEGELTSDTLRLAFPQLAANLVLRGDTNDGVYALAGPVTARGLALEDVGTANATARILFRYGTGSSWNLRANFAGVLDQLANETVRTVAGSEVRLSGALSVGANAPLVVRDIELDSEKLQLAVDSRIAGGRTSIAGSGRHADYGPFTVDAAFADAGPTAELVFADPLPAAGLEDVRVAIAPSESGFAIETSGGSLLGPFEGTLGLALPANAPARIDIEALRVWRTQVSGALELADAGVIGDLQLAGGGLSGTIALAPRGAGQGFDVDLAARQASFGGDTPLSLAEADIAASGAFADGTSRIDAKVSGAGLEYGALFVARFSADAEIENGRGDVTASIAGRRSDRFALKLDGDIAPDRIALLARGEFAGRQITMPRRAVLTARDGGGWSLSRTQVGFGRGYAVVEGAFGGGETAVKTQLANMPLSLADLAIIDLGFGGTVSGVAEYRQAGLEAPTADIRLRVDNFTRSGLVLSSQPIDVLLVADLTPQSLTGGAVLRDDNAEIGRVEGRIAGLPDNGGVIERLQRGRLAAQMRYDGDASALWRLAGVDTFDLAGPVAIRANASGTLLDPRINGNVSSDDLRVQSALSGTDIADVAVRGTFAGSRLRIVRFAGTAAGGGSVSGSGTVDFADMGGGRGPQIDLRAAVDNARLLNANGLRATLTGPLRIVSSGRGGTIAGRLRINRASWRLGVAAEDYSLPEIATREINLPVDVAPPSSGPASPWRYLVDATARSRIEVDGMGLDSEWGADIILRGTTSDPRIGGEARLVRGAYSFAGTRFELTEGRIAFDANVPINPRLDIEAETERDGIDVTVAIGGTSEAPEITFSSTPALPEEEILARLLFGGSITSLSATDALQLGAALASLRGGGGMDPVNQLRSAIGLDQLRIVAADPALDRGTGVALGKNIGQRFYVEIVTDGRGYSATSVEYRITRWLALLGTVTTIGRDSVVAEISRDY